MPIYEQGYRRYEARGPLRQIRFWPITREALRLVLVKRAFLGLLVVSWLLFLFRAAQIYAVTRFPEVGRALPVDGRLFGEFLNLQLVFAILLTIFGGAGLVASDLRSGGILVYLSRPLSRRDYVLGKLSVLLALNLSVTLVPGLLLYLIALALDPDQFAKWELLWIGPAIVVQSLVVSLSVGLVGLAVSALSKSARVAGLSFFALMLGLDMIRAVLEYGMGREEATILSLQANVRQIGAALFD